ncbi:S8 family serine peptidase [Flavobacterium sp. NST-5]|uniref:S8 family serine peptidase n=1 Tax=Flavobacterium ichthyis TaxID=2698827 RepID=A0ABW9ZG56_9FLAO|nr:S8 family peptidase [Flavobacterium ichthyis]NBL66075.1 S8 family serine peptidase [Flavobacterium ichthyis]
MKLIKLSGIALMLVLASCSATKSLSPVTSIDKIALKNADIKEEDLKRWSHLDIFADTIPGMSVDKAYKELIKGKKGKKVIVGVVDSGVDIEHPDLQGVIWNNPKEIPGNGIDDDKNGYIDDIHGWNFLGDINGETLEMTRIVRNGDDGSEQYKKAKAEFDQEYQEALAQKQQFDFIAAADNAIRKELKKDNYTVEDLQALNSSNAMINQVKPNFVRILSATSKEEFDKQIKEAKEYFDDKINYNLNLEFNGRKVVGDNVNDINDKKYGNNNVIGPDKKGASHGTHVSGIIAQVRGNGLGGDGVANNVEIMAVRAVPNGDEYDKDIALGIRYAVDNGAKVINGSFGKGYSPNKQWVYDALKYAGEKDVLVVLAAGNENTDLDTAERFPNDRIESGEITDNVIKVGALNTTYGSDMIAGFSNYGTKDVDVFAPGVQIYATFPDNSYEYEQGTSMASPNVAGVAVLIRSYYPDLKASQVKQILMDSGITTNIEVQVGGRDGSKRPFNQASKSGRMVNVYNALIMAEKMSKK